MARLLQVKVKGTKRLALKLDGIAAGLRTDILRRAAQVAALGLEGEVKARVPRDTGALAKTIRRELISSDASGAVVAVKAGGQGAHNNRPVAFWVEYGSSHAPAQPFMRPALRHGRLAAIRTIGTVIGQELRRKAGA